MLGCIYKVKLVLSHIKLILLFTVDMFLGKVRIVKHSKKLELFETSRQLVLPFVYAPKFHSSQFINAPSNSVARVWLGLDVSSKVNPCWPDNRLAIWGEAGTGKTHLLQIWAEKKSALYLTGSVFDSDLSLNWYDFIEKFKAKAIVIDDADIITNSFEMLHLLNIAKELLLPIVLGGRYPPARWKFNLPDLASRLRAMTAVEIEKPEDELLTILLLRLIAERQLVVSTSVIEWLNLYLPRSASTIREAVRLLDEAALSKGSGITKSLAAIILKGIIQ